MALPGELAQLEEFATAAQIRVATMSPCEEPHTKAFDNLLMTCAEICWVHTFLDIIGH